MSTYLNILFQSFILHILIVGFKKKLPFLQFYPISTTNKHWLK